MSQAKLMTEQDQATLWNNAVSACSSELSKRATKLFLDEEFDAAKAVLLLAKELYTLYKSYEDFEAGQVDYDYINQTLVNPGPAMDDLPF